MKKTESLNHFFAHRNRAAKFYIMCRPDLKGGAADSSGTVRPPNEIHSAL
jgi:hypothetical protein